MRKKTFFYKFDKNKHISKSSNHSFFVDKEDKTFDKLASLLEKKDLLNRLIDEASAQIENYYEERISKKKELINKRNYLKEYSEYLLSNKVFILSLKFNKILSYNDIEKITSNLWVNIIRVSWYDTIIEILSQNKNDFLNSLKWLVDSEIIIINDIIKENKEYDENNRYILSLENIEIDTINRKSLENINEWENIIISLSKEYILNNKLEFDILKEIYSNYKKENSKVEMSKDDNSFDISFTFQNLNLWFLEDIKILDSITNIEVIDSVIDYTFKEIELEVNWVSSESISQSLTKVLVAEDNKIINNIYYNGNLEYWKLEINTEWEHSTSVWLLCMYWKIDENNPILHSPDCFIYSSTYKDIFWNIDKVIKEALDKWCRIINISMWVLGFLRDNDNVSTIAKKIDKLLENKDILLVLSWWNIKPNKLNYIEISDEDSNINIPKDSFSSLVVWAKNNRWLIELYSRKNNIDTDYKIWEVKWSIYSFKNKKKPDLIDFWENIVFNWLKWWIWYWTSYAAPLIVNKAAKILNTYNNISTNTIKALFYNYSSIDNYNHRSYLDKLTFEKHIWKWDLNINLIEWNSSINIIIEDYIWNNEKKEYPIKLPNIQQSNFVINMKRSISYNPPIDENFSLKYCKFCVSSQIMSDFYEAKRQEIFNSKDNDIALEEWTNWKKEKVENKYKRPLDWVNYFWKNHLWVSNSFRENLLNKSLYEEIKNNTNIIIEWHSRNNFTYKQKFSFVMTIDISTIIDKESFIENFYEINNGVVIHWEDLVNINKNYELKEQIFNEITSNDVFIDVESF